jgi:hypothetical protein
MRRKFPTKAFCVPLFLLIASLISCNGEISSSESVAVDSAPTAAAAEPKEIAITSETPVDVNWRYCDTALFPTPPPDMPQYPVDADGCRVGDRLIQVWPLEDGTVEVYFVRGRTSPSKLGLGEAEGYWLGIKSRGCDRDGPQEEGFYQAGGSIIAYVDHANDQKFIQVPPEDVSLSAIEAPSDDGEVIGGFLFLNAGGCRQIDPDRVF